MSEVSGLNKVKSQIIEERVTQGDFPSSILTGLSILGTKLGKTNELALNAAFASDMPTMQQNESKLLLGLIDIAVTAVRMHDKLQNLQ